MTTRLDPATRSRVRVLVPALPFAIIAAIGVSRMVIGPGWGLLPLLAVGPAVAAAIGGLVYTLAAGAVALAVYGLFAVGVQPGAGQQGPRAPGPGGGTRPAGRRSRSAGVAAARAAPGRPGQARGGLPVGLLRARVGGDIYEVVTTPECVRLVVGDAKGEGLPAVRSAAAVLGVFREAAHEEDILAAIVSRIETSLARQLGDKPFVTAILAEVSADGTKIELLSCGHPAPLLLRTTHPRFIGPEQGSLPLGLGQLADVPRIPVTIPFEPGDALLFYTDGASEGTEQGGRVLSPRRLRRRARPARSRDPGRQTR